MRGRLSRPDAGFPAFSWRILRASADIPLFVRCYRNTAGTKSLAMQALSEIEMAFWILPL
jgi:hypothetical protein